MVPAWGRQLNRSSKDPDGARFEQIRSWVTDRAVDVEGRGKEINGPIPVVGGTDALPPGALPALLVSVEILAMAMHTFGRNPANSFENSCTLVNKRNPWGAPQVCARHIRAPVLVFHRAAELYMRAEAHWRGGWGGGRF